MRIVAGRWKGLALTAPAGDVARPTTDRVKEAIFSLMGISWSGGIAVDLFGGSGALGLETVSRGADGAVVVDKHPRSIAAIRENVRRCHADSEVNVWRMDWEEAWRQVEQQRMPVGWVFVDPPYRLNLWERVLRTIGDSSVDVLYGVVCEHPKSHDLPQAVGRLQIWKSKRYGDIQVTVFRSEQLSAREEGNE